MDFTPPPAPFRPPGFRFTPSRALEGPAFTLSFKLLACTMVGGCVAWFIYLYGTGQLELPTRVGWLYVLGGLGILVSTLWHILRSRTRINAEGLHQSWLWDKHVPMGDLAYAKLMRVKGLDWLIAPRLYTRTISAKFATFYVAEPALLAESERLVQELAAWRVPPR